MSAKLYPGANSGDAPAQSGLNNQPSLHIDSATARSSPSWLSIALTLTLCLVTIGVGALPFDWCVWASEIIIALSLTVCLFRGMFKGSANQIDSFAASWLGSQLLASAWAFHTRYYLSSPYTAHLYNGGEFGPLTHLGDVAEAIGVYLLVSRSNAGSSSQSILPLFASALGVGVLSIVEEARNLAFGTADPRIQGSFTNPNLLGAFVCIALPILLSWTAERDTHWKLRVVRGALTKCMIGVVILTQSRGAILGCAIGCAFIGLTLLAPKIHKLRNRALVLFPIVAAVTIAISMLLFPHLLHQGRSISDQQRETAWRGARIIIAEHPIFGLGDGSFPTAQSMLHLHESDSTTTARVSSIPSIHLHAHNLILESWVERGLFGAMTALWLVIIVVYGAIRLLQPNHSNPAQPLRVGAIGAMIATLCQNTPDYTLWYMPISMLFWFAIGLHSQRVTSEPILTLDSKNTGTK